MGEDRGKGYKLTTYNLPTHFFDKVKYCLYGI